MTKLPGLETSTGSLGMGLSVGIGFALAAQKKQERFHSFVMIHILVLVLDTRLGAEPRWVSVALGTTRTVPVERCGIAGSGTLVVW